MAGKVDIEGILKTLTLEEKISILAGRNMWETVPIPSKGVPSVKVSDGPNGARGADFTGGKSSACFPAACSVAAAFDEDIAHRIGQALAEETHSKGARCLLGPTTCMHRDPRGGRNFESFSEDPLLAGKLAASVIRGLQSRGVSGTIKHFAANEQETDRMTVRETIPERALREIYLRPFEIAIKESKPWAVMTAYNVVNGFHCDESKFLLEQVLRGEWGWDGLVMSDWGGTNSVDGSINAGLDLEMPGPARVRKIDAVVADVKAGKIQESTIDERARRVLQFIERLKAFEDDTIPEEQAIDKPEHRALIREAGGRGIVLLKNEKNLLPLPKDKLKGKKVALIGYAKEGQAHGGGSAAVNAHYKKSPWDALHEYYGDSVEFTYAKGAHTLRMLPGMKDNVVGLDGKPGWTLNFYPQGSSTPNEVKHQFPAASSSPIGSDASKKWTTMELIGDFTPTETGEHYYAASGLGPTQIFINDEKVWEQTSLISDPMGFLFMSVHEEEHRYSFKAGTTYRIRIRSEPPASVPGLEILDGRTGVRMGFQVASEHDEELTSEAVQRAKEADYAIVFTGHTPEWESEGQDQLSFNLPRNGSQDALIAAVAAANSNTVVVNATGVAVAMPWLDQIGGLLQTWYPGQECGNAIVDVLSGAVNPEGRLPCSFPKSIEDSPAWGNFPGEKVDGILNVTYEEGVFIGYRHYDRIARDRLNFPFGYGLSYTSFETSGLKAARKSDDSFAASVTVKNTGGAAGGSLVQLYAGRVDKSEDHPVKSLVAFKKVRLQPGESATVELAVTTRDLGFFDEKAKKWVVPAGKYELISANSAADVVETVQVTVEKELVYAP
ncbi:uncharacterized protein E0L32_005137 [Thyridium curvatum]|uniref:beta-glucosidase n=1 Tax=Thyridium curvatum TaxID=1093900 RepID=A0A507AXR6_9PEZI|nr:uncharacterized protein E0L32_005137 [Thyridium curvatum]TPX14742.1 hypothetical protein E0L32_005137 [Thyridium curvatum]